MIGNVKSKWNTIKENINGIIIIYNDLFGKLTVNICVARINIFGSIDLFDKLPNGLYLLVVPCINVNAVGNFGGDFAISLS